MKNWKYGDIYRLKDGELVLMVIGDSVPYPYCPLSVVVGSTSGERIGYIAEWDVERAPNPYYGENHWVKVEEDA